MTGREKIEAAFPDRGTTEIAATICYEGIFIRDHWAQLTDCPWWYAEAPELERQLAWRRDAIEQTGQDWFHLPRCPPREEREATCLEVRPDGVSRLDRRDGRRERLSEPQVSGWDESTMPTRDRRDRIADTPEKIDAALALPSGAPEDVCRDGRDDLAGLMLAELGGSLYPAQGVAAPLSCTYELWGFESMMVMLATRPDLVDYAVGRLLARAVHHVREAAALSAAGLWVEDAFTDQISPAAFERFNVTYLRPLTDEIRRLGMKSIYYYCGDPRGKWDLVRAIGADAYAFEESKKGFEIEIEEIVHRFDGHTVLGNLDAIGVLQQGTEEQLRAEVERQVAIGRRSGVRFVMCLGNPVTPETPVGRVRRYCDLVHEIGSRRRRSDE